MNKKIVIYSLVGLFILIFILIFLPFKTVVVVGEQEVWKAPPWADTIKNPYHSAWGVEAISPAILSDGQKLYNTYCVSCHDQNGKGEGAPGMSFEIEPANFHSEAIKEQTDGAILWKLAEGRGGMPSYKGVLSDEERWKLVTYIRQFPNQENGKTNFSFLEKTMPITEEFFISPKLTSGYFPLPKKIQNVVKSESQLFMVDTVVSGLEMPWSMTFLPDNTVLIAERSGKLLRIKNGKMEDKPLQGNIPSGLRDIKLDPQYKKNGLIYISYYIEPNGKQGGYTALMRARVVEDKLVEDEVLYKAGPFKHGGFWYGSKIAFDDEGFLYFTVGVSGKRENAQDLSNPSGKTMRFNRDGSIPSSNPFVQTRGALPEIYSYGHRVHEGLTYNPRTDEIWSTEFGELGGDEINVIKPGANYGWPEVTFSLEYSGEIISKDSLREDIEPPIHHMVIAPSDLAFMYGNTYPEWNGNLFIGGLRKSMPFLLRTHFENNKVIQEEELLENIGRVRDVEYAPDNFLYVMTEDTGLIVRLIPILKR
jgi:glucose/arabinose dehydrogenase/mono/diheme cytochrome c family protein